jgi:hypothetical protein
VQRLRQEFPDRQRLRRLRDGIVSVTLAVLIVFAALAMTVARLRGGR